MSDITSPPRSVHAEPMRELAVNIVEEISELEAEWRELQAEETGFIYQNFDWVRIAYETFEAENKPFIVTAREKGKLQIVLPLVILPGFPSILRWVGGTHANLCCGLYSREFLENPGNGTMENVLNSIQQHMRGIAILHLINQPETLAGFPNPILSVPHITGPNPYYQLDLRSGLDAILDMGSGKRKRKLFRKQQRVADSLGGYELVIPEDDREIRAYMEEFFAHKAARFKELGIKDVFSEKQTQEFLVRLAMEPQRGSYQPLRLYVLKVGGKMRAMYGEGIVGNYCQSCINAVVYDDFSDHSPNEMVLYLMLEKLISDGFEKFDLGLGHERYKISWCQSGMELMETVYPLSNSAVPFKWYLTLKTGTKDRIKSNATLWNFYKRVRKLFRWI